MSNLESQIMKPRVAVLLSSVLFTAGSLASAEVTFTVRNRCLTGNQTIRGIDLSPDGSKLYIAHWDEPGTVQTYSTSDCSLENEVVYGYCCHGDAVVSADSCYVFAPTYYEGDVSRWNVCAGNTRTALSAGSWPVSLAMNPDRSKMIVMGGSDGRNYDMQNDVVNVYDISGSNFSSLAAVPIPAECPASTIAFTPDGSFAYFTTTKKWAPGSADQLYEFSMTTHSVIGAAIQIRGESRFRSCERLVDIVVFLLSQFLRRLAGSAQ
jgi:DNA-binding beta-propeller fold protein YncE